MFFKKRRRESAIRKELLLLQEQEERLADAAMEKKKAINDAKDEIAEIAMSIAGKVVAREINAKDQAALVDHFIDELGDKA